MIEPIHRFAYEGGADPIDYAVSLIEVQIDCRDVIRAAREHTPTAYPIFKLSLSDEATARRIIAVLLDAGWSPPHLREEAS